MIRFDQLFLFLKFTSLEKTLFMEFASARLLFEEITLDDLEQLHHLHSLPEVDEFGTFGIPESIDVTKERLLQMINAHSGDPRKSYNWKIAVKNGSGFIGMAGIFLSLDKFKLGEIYYELDPEFWGKGFGTEIAKALIAKGFDAFGLHKIEAGVATSNLASVRILEKCGMTREGLRRKILPIRGQWIDNYHYAIVEDDPRDY